MFLTVESVIYINLITKICEYCRTSLIQLTSQTMTSESWMVSRY